MKEDNQTIDIRNCLDRRFKFNGECWSWISTVGNFEVIVVPQKTSTGTQTVQVEMIDCVSNNIINSWSHDVICKGSEWRERLQALVGKSMIRAQHRPCCPVCRNDAGYPVPMIVRSFRDRKFFGCMNFKKEGCRETKDITAAFEPDQEVVTSESHKNDEQKETPEGNIPVGEITVDVPVIENLNETKVNQRPDQASSGNDIVAIFNKL